jgi:hypothetical protein
MLLNGIIRHIKQQYLNKVNKMKNDEKGCSTCLPGQEQFEEFKTKGKKYVQYDYRYLDGELFTCVARNLEIARNRRNNYRQGKGN